MDDISIEDENEELETDYSILLNTMKKFNFSQNLLGFDNNGKICALGDYIVSESYYSFLSQLISLIGSGHCVMLEGGNSFGKKKLLENIAKGFGYNEEKSILKIYLGPHIDYRDLIGSYCACEKTGQLYYKPGILTKSLENSFLILDGWDQCPKETAQYLISIIDNKFLLLPNSRKIFASKNFKICCTYNSDKITKYNPLICLYHHWNQIKMPIPEEDFPNKFILRFFPSFENISILLIDLYKMAKSHFPCTFISFSRFCFFLSKFMKKVKSENHFDLECLLVLSINILCNSCPNEAKPELIRSLSFLLGIDSSAVPRILSNYHICNLSIKLDEYLTDFCFTESSYCPITMLIMCIDLIHPVLIIGPTGVGKTTIVKQLAHAYGRKLTVLNLGGQTDTSCIFGEIKPLLHCTRLKKIIKEFSDHFLYLNDANNEAFISTLEKLVSNHEYSRVLKLMDKVLKRISNIAPDPHVVSTLNQKVKTLLSSFDFNSEVGFEYVKSVIMTAMIEGHWLLLDELNLAPDDFLMALDSIFDKGSLHFGPNFGNDFKTHSNFRILACMNPSSEVGRKLLPSSLLDKFLLVNIDEIVDHFELSKIIYSYLKQDCFVSLVPKIAQFYLDLRGFSKTLQISSSYSVTLRSLCRAIKSVNSQIPLCVFRQLYELLYIFLLSGLQETHIKIWDSRLKELFGSNLDLSEKFFISPECVDIEGYPILRGSANLFDEPAFVLTDYIKKKIKILARIMAFSDIPILLEGDTAAGKTSLIMYLAKLTGNGCVRINNHDHTDIQDYIGSYTCTSEGQLEFMEGFLPRAMRLGQWVIFDELNLAPMDVFETLNRLLDENRELFIDETLEIVRPHPNFRIFATQNPSSIYSGRKELSSALKNRFCSLLFNDLSHPDNVHQIISKRHNLELTVSHYMIDVFKSLSVLRKNSDIFMGKYGFLTIRDLFRWAKRLKNTDSANKTNILIFSAQKGFELISARCRTKNDRKCVFETLNNCLPKNMKFSKNLSFFESTELNSLVKFQSTCEQFKHILWTKELLINAYMLCEALRNGENVLLVGETGCGKTSLCELYAQATNRKLFSFSCHSSMESSDIIGNMTVCASESKIFQWRDGHLPIAMRTGGLFLLDEIAHADDAVIERINGVLEDDFKTLVMHENVGFCGNEPEHIMAHPKFCFVATMNPGGDYGKRELSIALRNRLTEIWCYSSYSDQHILDVIDHNLVQKLKTIHFNNVTICTSHLCGDLISLLQHHIHNDISVRRLLDFINFLNSSTHIFRSRVPLIASICESLTSLLLDSFIQSSSENMIKLMHKHFENVFFSNFLSLVSSISCSPDDGIYFDSHSNQFIYPFNSPLESKKFDFSSLDVQRSVNRIHRAFLFNKPILLEGPPGSGKTSLVSFLAEYHSTKLVRINLSEQTEIEDLVGCYFPVTLNNSHSFKWINGPFLNAIINENWVLLDEINLASQSVLEGLNSCFDHRSFLFVAQLNKTFSINRSKIRVFGTQNPHSFSDGRKGLSRSFLDRFIVLNMPEYSAQTFLSVSCTLYPQIPKDISLNLANFIASTSNIVSYNVRDFLRILSLMSSNHIIDSHTVAISFFFVFLSKIRKRSDLRFLKGQFVHFFNMPDFPIDSLLHYSYFRILPHATQIGLNFIVTNEKLHFSSIYNNFTFNPSQRLLLGFLATAVNMNWPCLLTGDYKSGKTSLIKILSSLFGKKLIIIPITSETDHSDLLGDFEKFDFHAHFLRIIAKFKHHLQVTQSSSYNIFVPFFKNLDNPNGINPEELVSLLNNVSLSGLSNKILHYLEKIKEILPNIINRSAISITWIDGPLIRCVKRGYWVLLDNINFGNPAIIDRLNSLLESNGYIDNFSTHERIIPHPQFRFFASYNQIFGEVSNALRNRCMEIFIQNKFSLLSSSFSFCKRQMLSYSEPSAVYPSIDLIYSAHKQDDLITWDLNVITNFKPFLDNSKLLFLELAIPNDFQTRVNFLNLTIHDHKFIDTVMHKQQDFYSSLSIPFEYCSNLLIWNNFPLQRFSNDTYKTLCFKWSFYLRLLVKNFLPSSFLNIKTSFYDPIKQYLERQLLAVTDLSIELSIKTSLDLYLLLCYAKEFNRSLSAIEKLPSSHAILWWSWLRTIFDVGSDSLHNFESIDAYFNYPDRPIVKIYRLLYQSYHSPYFHNSNHRIITNMLFFHYKNSIKELADVIEYHWLGQPFSSQNFTPKKFSYDFFDIFPLLDLLINISGQPFNNQSKNRISFNVNHFPQCIQAILLIKTQSSISYSHVQSCLYLCLLDTLLYSHKKSNIFIFPSFFDQIPCLSSEFKAQESINLLDKFLLNDLPFNLKCKDLNNIRSIIHHQAVSIWRNFNFYVGRQSIIFIQLKTFLNNFVFTNLNPIFKAINIDVPNNSSSSFLLNRFKEITLFDCQENTIIDKLCIFFEQVEFSVLNHRVSASLSETLVLFGILLFKFFSCFPEIDPSFETFLHNQFITNHLTECDEESSLRSQYFQFNFCLDSQVICSRDLPFEFNENLKTRLLKSYFKGYNRNRSEITYNCLKTNLPIFLSSLESNIHDFPLLSDEQLCSLSDMKRNLLDNYVGFFDLVEPLIISLDIILLGATYGRSLETIHTDNITTKSDTNSTGALWSTILNELLRLVKINDDCYKKCIPKHKALAEFYNVVSLLSKNVALVLSQIHALDLLNASTYKFIELSHDDDFSLFQNKTLSLEITTKNSEHLTFLLNRIAFFVFELLHHLISETSSPTLDHIDCYRLFQDIGSDFQEIMNRLSLCEFIEKNITLESIQNSNIYEYGSPSCIPAINNFVATLRTSLLNLSSFESPIIEQLSHQCNCIDDLSVSAPLVIYINYLDQIYRSLLLWNSSCPSEHKLLANIDEIKNIVINLRKRQFITWESLLENSDKISCVSNSLIYFGLINLISSSDTDVFPILQNFICKQTFSTFSHSLTTIHDITILLSNSSCLQNRLISIKNLVLYYKQFELPFTKIFSEKTLKIKNKLTSFTKAAKWRDFNYWSIKESTEKSHRVLHKYVKSYRIIMNYPICHALKKVTLAIPKPIISNTTKIFDPNFDHSYPNIFTLIKNWIESSFYISLLETVHALRHTVVSSQNNSSIDLNYVLKFLGTLNLSSSKIGPTLIHTPTLHTFEGPDPSINNNVILTSNTFFLDGLYRYTFLLKYLDSLGIKSFEIYAARSYLSHLLEIVIQQRHHILRLEKINSTFSQFELRLSCLSKNPQNLIFIDSKIMDNCISSLSKCSTHIGQLLKLFHAKPNNTLLDAIPCSTFIDGKNIDDMFPINCCSKLQNILCLLDSLKSDVLVLSYLRTCASNNFYSLILPLQNLSDHLNSLKSDFNVFTYHEWNCYTDLIDQSLNEIEKIKHLWKTMMLIPFKPIPSDTLSQVEQKIVSALNRLFSESWDYYFTSTVKLFSLIEELYSEFISLDIEFCITHLDFSDNILCLRILDLVRQTKVFLQTYTRFVCALNEQSSQLFSYLGSFFTRSLKEVIQEETQEKEEAFNNQPSQPGGFSDGFGHDDVTDLIETQDQIDDTKRFDQLLNDDDTNLNSLPSDCSQGIELSDMDDAKSEEGMQDSNEEQDIEEDRQSSIDEVNHQEFNPDFECDDFNNDQDLESINSTYNKKNPEIENNFDGDSFSATDNEFKFDFHSSVDIEDSDLEHSPTHDFISSESEIQEIDNVDENEPFEYDALPDKLDDETDPTCRSQNEINISGLQSKTHENVTQNEKYTYQPMSEFFIKTNSNDFFTARKHSTQLPANTSKSNNNQQNIPQIDIESDLNHHDVNETFFPDDIYEIPQSNVSIAQDAKLIEPPLNDLVSSKESYLLENNTKNMIKNREACIDSTTSYPFITNQKSKTKPETTEISQTHTEILAPENVPKMQNYKEDVFSLSSRLCEQLRPIFEPTRLVKLSGAFKTGRKLNMRKLIPFIASNFTKDRIWKRRVKPQRRDYHIILAIDDSASMTDNSSQKIALQSMLLLATAFRLLEVGKVALLSFGNSVSTHLDFNEPCTEDKCRTILDNLAFSQNSTLISKLLDFTKDKFLASSTISPSNINERLLIILSDGRGVFSEGEDRVTHSIQALERENIFTIFVILDSSPSDSLSISRIKVPVFTPDSDSPIIKSYLELFPFSHYIILREINDLPEMLTSITHQWIQLTRQ